MGPVSFFAVAAQPFKARIPRFIPPVQILQRHDAWRMKRFLTLFRGIIWKRVLITLILTSAASGIVYPYFHDNVLFYKLWLRLSVVAMVMLLAFTMVGNLHFNRVKREHAQLAALILAAFLGTIVSGLLIGRSLAQMFTIDGMFWGIVVFTAAGIAIGVVAATLLVYREREARAFAELQASESQRYQLEKQVLEARLKLMQAQIEPHFLFNTLANVQHLVEANPPLAAATLESLITYLRAALPEMREDGTTLGRETAMAQAYLDIQRLRMGPRLDFSIDIPDHLRSASFPPMMLLTLVENAIKHGLDPLQQGGNISVRAALADGALIVSVVDTGQGLSSSAGLGVGLSNIRERLAALYGKTAKLLLEENLPQGLAARILIPYQS